MRFTQPSRGALAPYAQRQRGIKRVIAGFLAVLGALTAVTSSPAMAEPTVTEEGRPQPPSEPAGRLKLILERGELIVGVKSDYPPWGTVDEDGNLVGMEPDLAQDVADSLGVELQLEAVTTTNRLRKVQDGSIDLVIATMGDTLDRRDIAGIIFPHYYASGVQLLTPDDTPFTAWGQLRGRDVCLTAGAYYNRTLIERFLIDPNVFSGTRDTQLALRDGRCVGWAYDNTSLARLASKARWADYGTPLPTILRTPWAVAVRQNEADRAWGRFVSDMVVYWHRSGHLLEVESKWGLPESEFLREKHEQWTERGEDGNYTCARDAEGDFPSACIQSNIANTVPDEAALSSVALFLDETFGLDISPLYDSFQRQRLIDGVVTTLALSFTAIIGALVVGIGLASTLRLRLPGLTQAIHAIIAVTRTTPPILQLYIVFFGLGGLIASGYGLTLGGFLVAALVFSLYAGASNAALLATALRSAADESPHASRLGRFAHAIDLGYEGLVANSVNIVKAAGMASTIAVPELISATNGVISENGNAMAMMNILLVFYLVLVFAVLGLFKGGRRLVMRWREH